MFRINFVSKFTDEKLSRYETPIGPSLAKPNREITIKQMLKLHMQGQPLPACGLDVYYDDSPSLDNFTLLDKKNFDLSDIDAVRKQLFAETSAIAKGIDFYKEFKENQKILEEDKAFQRRFRDYFTKKEE